MKKYARICSHCGKPFNAGYVICCWEDYYCSNECLEAVYSKEQIEQLELGGEDWESYRTEWEESDYKYYEDWTPIEDSEEIEEETDKEIIYKKIADLYDYVQDSDYIEKEYILEELANIQSYANC